MFLSQRKTISLPRTAPVWKILLVAFACAFLITAGLYWLGVRKGIPLSSLTGDPAMIAKIPVYVGFLSNLGAMLWAAAAACALLGAALQTASPRRFQFLLASGLFTALLGFDDLFALHEHVLPHYLHVPEKLSYLGYFLLAAVFLLYFQKEIRLETDYPMMAAALLFFGLSLVITRLTSDGNFEVFLKDSLKFYGIVLWLVFYFCTVVRFAKQARPL